MPATNRAADRTERAERQIVAERITVGLIPKVVAELEELQESTGLSKTDLVNRAISLLGFVMQQTDAGAELLLRDPKTGDVGRVHLL
jgi:hypothetical protein